MSKALCLLHNPLESQRAKGGGLGSSDNLHDGSSNSEPYCRVGKILVALIVHGNHPAFGHHVICITYWVVWGAEMQKSVYAVFCTRGFRRWKRTEQKRADRKGEPGESPPLKRYEALPYWDHASYP